MQTAKNILQKKLYSIGKEQDALYTSRYSHMGVLKQCNK